MYRIVIEPSELEVGQSLYQTLRGHRVPTALHQDALATDIPAKCEYFVASSAFETQVGGTRPLIERARKVGAKSLVVICENPENKALQSE